MEYGEILKIFLLNEQGALKAIGKEVKDILGGLEGLEKGLGESGKFLRSVIKNLDNLDPAEFAKLEKRGVNIGELVSKAEKATAQNADSIAKEIDDAIKGNVSTAAGEITSTKAAGETTSVKKLSPEQQTNKDFDALIARADKLEKDGQLRAAANTKRRAYQMIGEEFEEATKLPSVKAEQWSKLNAQRIELLKNPNTPKQITDDVLRQMDSIYPRTTWQRIAQWARENPKKAWLFGFLGTGTLGAVGYEAYQQFKKGISPKPTPGPTPGPSPGPVSRKCKGTLKRGCKGDNVKEMQQKLINCGYSLPKKGADGVFGSETKSAVASFQKDNNLKVDGVAGKETLKALESCKAKNRDVEEKPSKEETPVPKQQEPEISPKGKTEEPSTTGFLEKTFQDIDKLKKARATDDLTSRETAQRQYEKDDEKFKKFQADLGESKLKRTLNIIKNRNDSIENIVFERLVKGCK